MKRTEQKEKRRKEILNAGLDLFIRKGYAATKTSDIAAACGMSEGLLFHYFESKEKLYLYLIEFASNCKNSVFDYEGLPPLQYFEFVANGIIDYIAKDNFAAKLFVLMNQAQFNEALPEEVRSSIVREKDMEITARRIERGQREGTISEGDPVALAITFWSSIQGVAEMIARNPEMPAPRGEWIVGVLRKTTVRSEK